MTDSTATAIASGAGPLIAALIGAHQLWLKTTVEEQRDLPFDVDRLKALEKRIRAIRRNLTLFILLVAGGTAIPVGGTIAALLGINFGRPVSLSKVLVVFLSAVGVVHVVFPRDVFVRLPRTEDCLRQDRARGDIDRGTRSTIPLPPRPFEPIRQPHVDPSGTARAPTLG